MRRDMTDDEIRAELTRLDARAAHLRRALAARRHWLSQPINPISWQPQPQPRVTAAALPTTAFVVFGD
jgi:hypothetical protein